MDKFIVVQVHPFIMGQHIYVMDKDGNVLNRTVADFDSAPIKIIEVAKQYDIKDIHLSGSKVFTEKIKDNIFKKNHFEKEEFNIIIE